MYLTDTNVLAELTKLRPDPLVLAWFDAQRELTVSAVTLEELAFGVARARAEQAERLARWLDALLAASPTILPVDERVALSAGRLRAAREATGRVVAQADMLIAATASVSARVLVTRNVRDFEGCGVALLNPFAPSPRASRR